MGIRRLRIKAVVIPLQNIVAKWAGLFMVDFIDLLVRCLSARWSRRQANQALSRALSHHLSDLSSAHHCFLGTGRDVACQHIICSQIFRIAQLAGTHDLTRWVQMQLQVDDRIKNCKFHDAALDQSWICLPKLQVFLCKVCHDAANITRQKVEHALNLASKWQAVSTLGAYKSACNCPMRVGIFLDNRSIL